ncbi:MAG TPA: cytochrome c [Pyrinomonadaceae bacterium]|jgi:mono/diheme cytochrome c family protein
MRKLKLSVIIIFLFFGLLACAGTRQKGIVIADSKKYEASLFRQNCAICHGAEAEGKTLDDGKQVPSLRSGAHKFVTEAEIYRQISEGGNGMTPFRNQLSEREIRLMSEFVYKDLRGN